MMNILLRNQVKIALNTIRTQRWQNIAGFGVAIAVIGFFLYWFVKLIWAYSDQISPIILENLLSYGFLAVIGMIILMGLPQVFKGLYSGSDLEMLFAMPIPTRNIFWVKYIQSYFGIPLFIFSIVTVPIVVYGVAIQASLLYFVIALLVLFAVTLIGLSIIYLFNLLLIQVMPPSRANEFMTVMGFLSGILVYLMFVLPNMMSDESMTERFLSGMPVLPKWIPTSWGSSAISNAIEGSLSAFGPLVMILLFASIMMIITTFLVEKGFRTGWIRLSEQSSKKRSNGKADRMKQNHPVIAIGKKEWYSVKRDLREWLTYMPILFFLIFGVIGFIQGGGDLTKIRGHHEVSWPIAQGIFLFLLALMSGMTASSSIGREGPNLWIVQVLPISGKQLAYGKFWISWLIPILLVIIIEVVVAFFLGWTFWQLVMGFAVKGLITTGMSAMGLWIGTFGAKYNPTNPQQRLTFGANVIQFVLSYVYLFIALIPAGYLFMPEVALNEIPKDLEHGMTGFVGVLATISLIALSLKVSYPILMTIVGIIVLLLLSIGIAYLFLLLSARRIERGLKIDMVSESSSKSLRRPKGKGGSLY